MHAGRWVVIGMLAAALAVVWAGYELRKATAPPSVVLVTIDTLRADRLGAYGRSPSITPALDALAARGVVFERAWTVAPLTVPAHATLLTGLLPPRHGLRLNQPSAPLPAAADRRFFTLAEVMKEQGYATGAFVSASVLRNDATGLGAGFDVYDEVPAATPGAPHDAERPGRGAEAIERALAFTKSASGPAFVWVHLFDPHAPYDAPVGWGAGPDHAADAEGYDAEVAYTDHCIGLLMKGLTEQGLGNSIVAIVADHGEALGEHGEATHGYLLHEATLHVPLIFVTPGLAPARRTEPVSSVDVFPTLLALSGRPVPPQVNGRPLFETSRQATGAADRPIYAESIYGWHACRWAQTFALRRGDRKLVASGPKVLSFDLGQDPAENRPSEPDAAQRDAVAQMLVVARETPLGVLTEGADAGPVGSYWSMGTGGGAAILSDEENAKLASPYDRMDVLRDLDAARVTLCAGDAASALTMYAAVVARDPANIQAEFWRARCLEALGRDADAAAAYRRAFELGFRSPKCVAKALQCGLKASSRGDAAAWDAAVAFLKDARGKRSPDDAATYLFEAFLHLETGHVDRALADEALRRAAAAPGADAVRKGIDQARELLQTLPK